MSKHHSKDIEAVKRALRKVANQPPTVEEDILDQLVIEGWEAPRRIYTLPWYEAVTGQKWVLDPLNHKRRVQLAQAVVKGAVGGKGLRIHLMASDDEVILTRTVHPDRLREDTWWVEVLDE